MPGGFSIQGLQLHKVLQGAHKRYHELQDEDWKTEKDRRDEYIKQLSALIPNARNPEDVAALNNEIAAVIAAPREKPYKPKLIKTPSIQAPARNKGQRQGQSTQSTGKGAGGATPPPFDFAQLSAMLMGGGDGAPQHFGMPDVPQSQGGPPDSVGATPPTTVLPTASMVSMVPPVGAGSLGATGAPTPTLPMPSPAPMGLTPPAMPTGMPQMPQQVVTPPGRSVPEPSPLVGTLPGTPSPTPAPAGPQMAMATPPPIGAGATPPSVNPNELSVNLMGYEDRARLPYELNAEYGMSKTGRSLSSNAKPLITIKDLVSAADKGLDIVPDPSSPTGYSVIPRTGDELSLKRQAELADMGAKIDLNIARTKSLDVRDRLATERPALMRELAAARNAALERSAANRASTQGLRATMLVKNGYDKGVKVFRDMERSLSQLEGMIAQRTGPGDYGAIIQFVHGLDNTAAREGEVAMARSAASLANRFEQLIEKWKSGDLLADEVRQEFLSAARASNSAFQEHRNEIDQQYAYIADQNGIDKRMIGIPGASSSTGAPTPTPMPVVGATPSSPKAPARPSGGGAERWVRDPTTGKLRKAS